MFSFFSGSTSGQDVIYPELATARTKEEYEQLAKDKLEWVLGEETKESPPLTFNDIGEQGLSDIMLYDRPAHPATPTEHGVKVVGTLPVPPKEVYETLWDLKLRKTIEVDLIDIVLVEKITDDIEVTRTRYSAPFPVTAREIVAVRYRVERDGVYYVISFSVNHNDVKSDSNYVRAVLHINALICKPLPDNKTEFTRIIDVEPKGNIPNFVVNITKTSAARFVVLLRKALFDLHPREDPPVGNVPQNH